jgi:hypothetical protein
MGLNSFKMISPKIGSSVPLLFDERSGKVKFDVDDPRIALDGGDFLREDRHADRDQYKSALKGSNSGVGPSGTSREGGAPRGQTERRRGRGGATHGRVG